MSCQSCGCDREAAHVCEWHKRNGVPMKPWQFEAFVDSQARYPIDNVEYSFFGLAGEAGECMEWAKKAIFRKDPSFTTEELKKELGDVLHYVTRIALYYGWNLEDLMAENVRKINERVAERQGQEAANV